MAPVAIESAQAQDSLITNLKEAISAPVKPRLDEEVLVPPPTARARLEKAGIDWKKGYPFYPEAPLYRQEVDAIRTERTPFIDPGTRADPEKKALFGAAKSIRHLGHR